MLRLDAALYAHVASQRHLEQKLHLVDELRGESHNNVPWHEKLPGIAGLTNRLQELGFVVTHVDNGPNTSIFWARRQSC